MKENQMIRHSIVKIIISIIFCLAGRVFAAGGHLTDPVTTQYVIYITNNTEINMNLTAINLDHPFSIDRIRMFEASSYIDITPNPKWSSLLTAHSTKAFAVAVRNYKAGSLDIEVGKDGTRFRILQSNNVQDAKQCFATQSMPRFACVLDMSQPDAKAHVSLSRVGDIFPGNPVGSSIELFINVNNSN
jgi:hypothetical protein